MVDYTTGSHAECGRKGGETGEAGETHPMDGWTPIPDALAAQIGKIGYDRDRVDQHKVLVWLLFQRSLAARRAAAAKQSMAEVPFTRASVLSKGIGLTEERILDVLRQLQGQQCVEEGPDGWRIIGSPEYGPE